MRRDVPLWLLVILCAGLAGALIALMLRGSPTTLSEPIDVPTTTRPGADRRATDGARGPRTRPRTERQPPGGASHAAPPAAARPAPQPQPAPAPAPAPPPPPVDEDDDDDDREDGGDDDD
jgi:hypothetical protein